MVREERSTSSESLVEGFKLDSLIGSGGFGQVWKAEDQQFRRLVAIKIGHAPLLDQRSVRLFERECESLGRLGGHGNIIQVYGGGKLADGRPYLVTEFVEGGTLFHRLTKRTLDEEEVVSLGIDIGRALVSAHERDVVHRDIKPANIFLRDDGTAVLGDFGIAKLANSTKTATGSVVATLEYAAPEVFSHQASAKSDMYSLGATLYESIAGKTPFGEEDSTPHQLLDRILNKTPTDLAAISDVSPELGMVIMGLLAREPNQRPLSASVLVNSLEQFRSTTTATKPLPLAPTKEYPKNSVQSLPVGVSDSSESSAQSPGVGDTVTFGQTEHISPEGLASALATSWDAAIEKLKSGPRSVFAQELTSFSTRWGVSGAPTILKRFGSEPDRRHQLLTELILALDPSHPPVYRSWPIGDDQLADSAIEMPAEIVNELLHMEVLLWWRRSPGLTDAFGISLRWAQLRSEYREASNSCYKTADLPNADYAGAVLVNALLLHFACLPDPVRDLSYGFETDIRTAKAKQQSWWADLSANPTVPSLVLALQTIDIAAAEQPEVPVQPEAPVEAISSYSSTRSSMTSAEDIFIGLASFIFWVAAWWLGPEASPTPGEFSIPSIPWLLLHGSGIVVLFLISYYHELFVSDASLATGLFYALGVSLVWLVGFLLLLVPDIAILGPIISAGVTPVSYGVGLLAIWAAATQ